MSIIAPSLHLRRVLSGAALLIAAAFSFPAPAQTWPAKPVRFIVPFPPGGGTDAFARPLAARLGEQLGAQIIIDSRGGAGGTIGADVVAKSAPDGYTFLVGAVHHTVAVSAYPVLPYDLERDLAPVTGIAYVPDVLVVNSRLEAKSVKELVEFARANPKEANYGSSGNGTTRHLAGEIFNTLAGTRLVHVPYKGSGPAMTGLLGGEITLIFEGLGSAAGHIRSGKIRGLAVTSARRSPTFPDIPTMAEAGFANFESLSWYGLWAPAKTPPEIIARMQAEIARVLQSDELKRVWFQQGAEPGGEPTPAFACFVRTEIEKWAKVVKQHRIVIQ